MPKQRKHKLTITVTFDKNCTAKQARYAVRDCIHGEFYCTAFNDGDPETFKVSRIGHLPQESRPC